jgi:Domain of unknown function (DUF4010)
VIACLGFLNYVLLRVYGSKGIYLTAVLGGLVNSTATAAELISTLSGTDLVELTVPVILMTSVSMFFRNLAILAIFAHYAIRTAALPLISMAAVAGFWIYRDRHKAADLERDVALNLGSPVSLKKVSSFALLFLALQVVATLGQRLMGNTGFQICQRFGRVIQQCKYNCRRSQYGDTRESNNGTSRPCRCAHLYRQRSRKSANSVASAEGKAGNAGTCSFLSASGCRRNHCRQLSMVVGKLTTVANMEAQTLHCSTRGERVGR